MFSASQQRLLDKQQHPFYRLTMRLGGRLRLAREKRGLKQEQLAEKASALGPAVSQAAISALEKRDSETTTYLFQFAAVLEVRAEWLQDGVEPSGLEADAAITLHRSAAQKEPSDAENLLLIVRSFLDTDSQGKSALVKAATKVIPNAYGTARATQPRRIRRR